MSSAHCPRVLLADDHLLVAEALKSLLTPEFDLVGVVEDGRALVEAAGKLQPLVVPKFADLKLLQKPIQPKRVPKIHLELQRVYDEYQQLVNDPKTAPKHGISAALIAPLASRASDPFSCASSTAARICASASSSKASPFRAA